ncbi:TPA: malonyl-ACP O-methyltransferase BioC [Neisseria weaveri]
MLSTQQTKTKIAETFSLAAGSYDSAANLQQTVGSRLLSLFTEQFSDGLWHKKIADIGAGSGWFSQAMQQQHATVYALDIAPGMLSYIQQNQRAEHTILADAETLPLASDSLNGCFSSLALQWCNLGQAAQEMKRITQTGGHIAVSTLSNGSLWQLTEAWKHTDNNIHTNEFLDIETICQAFQGFTRIRHHSETVTQEFDSVKQLLQGLKKVGANHVVNRTTPGLTGKKTWQNFQTAYEQYRTQEGRYPLDYQVVYIIATV